MKTRAELEEEEQGAKREELGREIYAAILAGAGARGGTYGEADLRRYAMYSLEAADIYYDEFSQTVWGSVGAVEQGEE